MAYLKNFISLKRIIKGNLMFFLALMIVCPLLSSNCAFAGEVLYDIETSKDPQDALVIGKVERIDKTGYVEINIVRLISGELESSIFPYRFSNMRDFNKVNIGDTFLLAVEKVKENNMYEAIYDVCYHVKIDENRRIRIIEKVDSRGDSAELEWFCNTGEDLIDGSDDNLFELNKETGEETLVYDTKTKKWYKDSTSESYSAPDVLRDRNKRRWTHVFLTAACLLLCMFVYLFIRWHKRRKCEI